MLLKAPCVLVLAVTVHVGVVWIGSRSKRAIFKKLGHDILQSTRSSPTILSVGQLSGSHDNEGIEPPLDILVSNNMVSYQNIER
jgi:hypothetical protein